MDMFASWGASTFVMTPLPPPPLLILAVAGQLCFMALCAKFRSKAKPVEPDPLPARMVPYQPARDLPVAPYFVDRNRVDGEGHIRFTLWLPRHGEGYPLVLYFVPEAGTADPGVELPEVWATAGYGVVVVHGCPDAEAMPGLLEEIRGRYGKEPYRRLDLSRMAVVGPPLTAIRGAVAGVLRLNLVLGDGPGTSASEVYPTISVLPLADPYAHDGLAGSDLSWPLAALDAWVSDLPEAKRWMIRYVAQHSPVHTAR